MCAQRGEVSSQIRSSRDVFQEPGEILDMIHRLVRLCKSQSSSTASQAREMARLASTKPSRKGAESLELEAC